MAGRGGGDESTSEAHNPIDYQLTSCNALQNNLMHHTSQKSVLLHVGRFVTFNIINVIIAYLVPGTGVLNKNKTDGLNVHQPEHFPKVKTRSSSPDLTFCTFPNPKKKRTIFVSCRKPPKIPQILSNSIYRVRSVFFIGEMSSRVIAKWFSYLRFKFNLLIHPIKFYGTEKIMYYVRIH